MVTASSANISKPSPERNIAGSEGFVAPELFGKWEDEEGHEGQGRYVIFPYRDPKSGTYARFLKVDPGWKGTESKTHPYNEVSYIIKGGIIDLSNNKVYREGDIAYFPKGVPHGPFYYPLGVFKIEFRHYA